ncbi:MAG TPA: NAD(P)/FAD-dependent oxidoreductase [Steroidobacteraceae bacterium]|nr:NAD(P)/FAD-dependent oxidoreductase [Steroidobacteraceae bacterium]
MRPQAINIVGAGMAGSLLAVLLAKRGFQVSLYDKRPDPRQSAAERGRSINLALAARGIRALERAGVMDAVRPLLIEMRGRMIHDLAGDTKLLPYGWKPGEVIYSIGRAALTRLLVEVAARYPNVTLSFNQTCIGASAMEDVLRFRDENGDDYDVKLTPTIGADGAGSVLRTSFAADGYLQVREELLDHDYKELTLPPLGFVPALDMNALHVWPRGGFMLIALPNTDGSFTATLFLAKRGAHSFESLATPAAVSELFAREFADAVPLIPRLLTEFFENPQGQLGTVHTAPWHVRGQALLLGDAAHAIVPFHGQGMNAAFEDCTTFDELLDHYDDWEPLFAAFDRLRRPNAEAIAQMALENYVEMRDTVRDPRFERFKALSVELERRFPDRFIPRYSMVMFHPEIAYADALHRGKVQEDILAAIDAATPAGAAPDFERARFQIEARLPKLSGFGLKAD